MLFGLVAVPTVSSWAVWKVKSGNSLSNHLFSLLKCSTAPCTLCQTPPVYDVYAVLTPSCSFATSHWLGQAPDGLASRCHQPPAGPQDVLEL